MVFIAVGYSSGYRWTRLRRGHGNTLRWMLDAALIKGKMYIFWSPKHDKQLEKHAVNVHIDSIVNLFWLSLEKCPEKELKPPVGGRRDTRYRRYYTLP